MTKNFVNFGESCMRCRVEGPFVLGETFCEYLLGSFRLFLLGLVFLFSFCLDDQSIGESEVLKTPTII